MQDSTVLVVNAGSSSLKVKVFPQELSVVVERIGGDSRARASFGTLEPGPLARHDEALEAVLAALDPLVARASIEGVGHRVVHGGMRYSRPVLIDDGVEAAILELAELAPLHNPANLEGIRAARRALPGARHVAVFDTAFHATLPRRAYLYGLPMSFYRERRIRRYGFHGPSHDYVTQRAARLLGRARTDLKIVSLHLGNGASAAAVDRGVSVDTSMGLTPLEGLLMGTRAGDVDPGVLLQLLRQEMSVGELDDLLNRRSGLAGMSGVSNDMRDVRRAAEDGNGDARAALEVFAYRVRKVVGAYAAAMGGLDAVVFTGGIGENDAVARAESLAGLGFLGVSVDPERNRRGSGVISPDGGAVVVLVVPTDEERMIADATVDAAGLGGGEPDANEGATA